MLILLLPAVTAQKPKYEVGSAMKLSFAKPKADAAVNAAWKLSNDDDDVINADDLLDEEDRSKPNPSSLKGEKYSSKALISMLNCTYYYYR